jgi:hypothetical protein
MAKTNVFMNYKSVTWIATGGSGAANPITEVTDIQEINAEGIEPWRADGSPFPTVMARGTADRGLTIFSGDVATMQGIPKATPLTIVAVLYDAVNGSGSGALTKTWTNAVVADRPSSGPSNKYAGGSISFMCFSPDGTTDPLTNSQAA